jgi:copper chaperone CopZ
MATSEYQVTGITCGHCEMSIREEVSRIPGVDDAAVLTAVDVAGYSAVRVS